MNHSLGRTIFLLLCAGPLTMGLVYALGHSLGLTGLLATGWTFEHWTKVLGSREFWLSMGFSTYVAVTSLAISVATALWISIAGRQLLHRKPLSYLIYLPLTLPAMVVAFLFFQWLSQSGLLSRIVYNIGWTDSIMDFPNWINDPWGVGIIAAHVFMATPFLTLFFLNIYDQERIGTQRQLALTLGARPDQATWRVTIPVLLWHARPTLILYGIFVMGAYEIPLLLGAQSPQMIAVLAIRKLQRFNLLDIPQAYVISLLFCMIAIGVVFFGLRGSKQGGR